MSTARYSMGWINPKDILGRSFEKGSDELWEDYGPQFMAMSSQERILHFTSAQIDALTERAVYYEKQEKLRIEQEKKELDAEFNRRLFEPGNSTLDDEYAQAAYDCTLEQCAQVFRTVYGGRWIRPELIERGSPHWFMFYRLHQHQYFEERIVGDPVNKTFSTYYRLKGT